MADPVSLEQRVAAVILEWDREHTESRAAEVIALCRGAIALDIELLKIAQPAKPFRLTSRERLINAGISLAAAAARGQISQHPVVGGPLEPRSEK